MKAERPLPPVDLSPALDFTIRDDEPLSVLQIQAERNGKFACMLLSNGTVRCLLTNGNSQAALPADLGPVTQLARGAGHSLCGDGGGPGALLGQLCT